MASVDTTGLTVNRHARSGSPVWSILHEAKELSSDLIVLGTHGRSGFDTWILPLAKEADAEHLEHILATGKPHAEILRVARERDVHLIAMGVHGRNPIDLMFFGSTTHHVIRGATCPVLTFKE